MIVRDFNEEKLTARRVQTTIGKAGGCSSRTMGWAHHQDLSGRPAQDALSESRWGDLLHLRNGFYRGSAGG